MSKERYKEIQEEIEGYGFTIVAKDFERPWGAFLIIEGKAGSGFCEPIFGLAGHKIQSSN